MKKIILILTALVLLVFLIIGLGIFFTWDAPYYERETAVTEDALPDLPENATEESLLAALNGTIEGSLSYPSEFIPEMEVCAENIETEEEFCTYEQIEDQKYIYGYGYKIEVPEGNYQVFARLTDVAEDDAYADYKAYYSDFVTCGLEYDCPSHNPITVEVSAGETVAGVDPHDWYADLEPLV